MMIGRVSVEGSRKNGTVLSLYQSGYKYTNIQIQMHKYTNTNSQKHKDTNTAYDKMTETPNICYIFEQLVVQGCQK